MDWSKRGVLAIALGSVVYLLNADTSDSSSLCSTGSENTYISSLQWNKTGQYLAIGTSNADVQVVRLSDSCVTYQPYLQNTLALKIQYVNTYT